MSEQSDLEKSFDVLLVSAVDRVYDEMHHVVTLLARLDPKKPMSEPVLKILVGFREDLQLKAYLLGGVIRITVPSKEKEGPS